LKLETQTRDDHQVRLVAEFDQEQFEKYKHQAARKLAHEAKIPGFRPGKAPYDVVKRTIGEKAITEQALDLMVEEVYPDVIKEAGIHPYGPGALDQIVQLEPPTLAFLIPLEPSVELGDYSSVRLPYEPKTVTDKDVDESVERVRSSYATVEPADRAAQEGDLVYLNVHGHLTHPLEEEEAEVFKDAPAQVWIRPQEEQPKEEWPYVGFSRDTLGVSAGEEKILVHVFTEDASEENLRGREVEFHMTIESVKSMKLPEIDEEFLQKMGNFKTEEELRTNVKTRLEKTAVENYDDEYFVKLTDKIRETTTLGYPPQAVEEETETVLDSIKNDLARQNLDFESYLKIRQTDKDTFVEKEIKPVAVKRLERSLILEAIGKAENLKLNVDEVTNMVTRSLGVMQESGELKRNRGRMTQDQFTNALAMEAAARTMNKQVLERVKDIATGKAGQTIDAQSNIETPVSVEAMVSEETPASTDVPASGEVLDLVATNVPIEPVEAAAPGDDASSAEVTPEGQA
jgi:trigger factor